jgi:hypothetical protein
VRERGRGTLDLTLTLAMAMVVALIAVVVVVRGVCVGGRGPGVAGSNWSHRFRRHRRRRLELAEVPRRLAVLMHLLVARRGIIVRGLL